MNKTNTHIVDDFQPQGQAVTAAPQGTPSIGSDPAAIAAPAAAQLTTAGYMRAAKRWVVWACDKQPFYVDGTPRRGTLDTPQDIARLGTFDDACHTVQARNGQFVGIGFAGGPDGKGWSWQLVDLDKISQNALSDLANSLPGYVELSPSGNGCHGIGYGRDFKALGPNGTGIEAAAGGKYLTYTGNTIRDVPIMCLADFVEQHLAPRHGIKRPSASTPQMVPVDPKTVTELRSALFAIPADEYDIWYRMGMALSELGPTGRELWLTWSATCPEKFNAQRAAEKWKTFRHDNTGYQAVFAEANRHGWVNPNSNAARSGGGTVIASNGEFKFKFARSGDAVVRIEYLIDPWLPRRTVIGCYGRGEAGKSTWAATMGAAISHQHSTLWISSEEEESQIRKRHSESGGQDATLAIKTAHPKKIDPISKKPLSTSFNVFEHLDPMIEALKQDREYRKDRPLGLIVLDAIVALTTWQKGENPNDDAAVKRLIAFLVETSDRHDVTILMLGHLNKSKSDYIADLVTGAAAWTNSTRLSYMFVKDYTADFQGFVRTVKSNTGTPFGVLYRTVPVHTLSERADGHSNVLCRAEMIDDVIWGETALRRAISDDEENDRYLQGLDKKKAKVDAIIDRALHLLRMGPTSRSAVEAMLLDVKPSRRHWLDAERALVVEHGVQIHAGAHNTKIYSLPNTVRRKN